MVCCSLRHSVRPPSPLCVCMLAHSDTCTKYVRTYVPTYSCNTNTITRQAHSQHTHNFNTASKQTNLPVLQALTGECGFLAANLYARSIFGEDALANLSIERLPGSAEGTPVTGHIRIRAKSQVRVCVCVHVCVCMCWWCECDCALCSACVFKNALIESTTLSPFVCVCNNALIERYYSEPVCLCV